MITRLEQGASKSDAATFAYTSVAFPMLTGTLVTVAGFVPIGFARSSAGEYTFSIFAVVGIALVASWFVAVLFSPLLGVAILSETAKHGHGEPGRLMRGFRRVLLGAMRFRWTIGLGHPRALRPIALWDALRPAAVLPRVRPSGIAG